MRFEAAHLAGREVGDDDDAAADEVLRCVPLGNAGEDLALAELAEVDFQAEELVGLGDALGDDDLRDPELDLGEVVDGDLLRLIAGRRLPGAGRWLPIAGRCASPAAWCARRRSEQRGRHCNHQIPRPLRRCGKVGSCDEPIPPNLGGIASAGFDRFC